MNPIKECGWKKNYPCNDCEKYCSIEDKIRLGWDYEIIKRFYKSHETPL